MRRILSAFIMMLWTSIASANVPCTLPFTLTNGTLADATQVMANYNAIVTCLGQAAAQGSNTDITALLGLTTPLGQAGGGSAIFIGGTSTGAANVQVVATTTPTGFTLAQKSFVVMLPGFTNNGPATLAVGATAATAVNRQTATGLQPLGGGELLTGQAALLYFDGTVYELLNPAAQATVAPCTVIDYAGIAVPSGYLTTDGSAVSRTTFAALFNCLAYTSVAATTSSGSGSVAVANSALYQVGWSVGGPNVTCNSIITGRPDGTHIAISNTAGSSGATTLTIGPQSQGDCSTTFTLPNYSGQVLAMIDTAGVNLTNTCAPAASIGTGCGAQKHVIANSELPGTIGTATSVTNGAGVGNGQTNTTAGAGGAVPVTSNATAFVNLTVPAMQNVGGGNALALMQPTQLVLRAIKF